MTALRGVASKGRSRRRVFRKRVPKCLDVSAEVCDSSEPAEHPFSSENPDGQEGSKTYTGEPAAIAAESVGLHLREPADRGSMQPATTKFCAGRRVGASLSSHSDTRYVSPTGGLRYLDDGDDRHPPTLLSYTTNIRDVSGCSLRPHNRVGSLGRRRSEMSWPADLEGSFGCRSSGARGPIDSASVRRRSMLLSPLQSRSSEVLLRQSELLTLGSTDLRRSSELPTQRQTDMRRPSELLPRLSAEGSHRPSWISGSEGKLSFALPSSPIPGGVYSRRRSGLSLQSGLSHTPSTRRQSELLPSRAHEAFRLPSADADQSWEPAGTSLACKLGLTRILKLALRLFRRQPQHRFPPSESRPSPLAVPNNSTSPGASANERLW